MEAARIRPRRRGRRILRDLPPRPWLLTQALLVDFGVLAVWWVWGLYASSGGVLLFTPMVVGAGGLLYACWQMGEFPLVLRGSWAVSHAFLAATMLSLEWHERLFIVAWSVLSAAGCWQGVRAQRNHGKRPRPDAGIDRIDEPPPEVSGRLARRWRPVPRPAVLTWLLFADFLVLGAAFAGLALAIARHPGGLLVVLFPCAALFILDLLAWQMHRFGLIVRAAAAVGLVLVAIFTTGALTPWTLLAIVHAAVSCWIVATALAALDAHDPESVPDGEPA